MHSAEWLCVLLASEMRPISLLFLVYFFLASASYAQLNFDVNVSDGHLRKVKKAKDARSKLKNYKKYYSKDSLKAAKRAWKDYRNTYKDSLKQAGQWEELKEHKEEFMVGEWSFPDHKQYALDTSFFQPPKDSLEWAVQELARRGSFEEIQALYESYGQYDSSYLKRFAQIDSLHMDPNTLAERFQTKERLSNYLPEELRQESDLSIDNQMKYGKLDQFGQLQKVDRSGVKEFFQNVDPEQFSRAMVSMTAAKKKYAVLPDLSKEEEGIKRNSLKGTPLKKRLFLNGNIALQSTNPLILDANVQLGYRWTQKLSTGIGILYREQFTGRDSTSAIMGDAHGWSAFVNYDIAKGFFVYSEAQQVINQPIFGESNLLRTKEQAYFIGMGRKFSVGKHVKLSVMMLYDLNYRNNSLNQRPLVPRIGYSVSL